MKRRTTRGGLAGFLLREQGTASDVPRLQSCSPANSGHLGRLAALAWLCAACCLGASSPPEPQPLKIPRFFAPTEDLVLELQPVVGFAFTAADINCLGANTRGDYHGYVRSNGRQATFLKVQNRFYNAGSTFIRDVLTETSYATSLAATVAMNDLGQVLFVAAGRYTQDPNGLGTSSRLILFNNGSMMDIGVPAKPAEPGGFPYFYVSGYAAARINNRGTVLIGDRFWGRSYLRNPDTGQWTTLAANTDWIANDLNDNDEIVGQFLGSGKGGILTGDVLQEIPRNPGTGQGINAPISIGNDGRILWTSGHVTDRAGNVLQTAPPAYGGPASLTAGARITPDGALRYLGASGKLAIHYSGDTIDSTFLPATMARYFPQPAALANYESIVHPVDIIDHWKLLDGWLGPVVPSAPVIVTQPTTVRVRLGAPAEFYAVVAGPLTYWTNNEWNIAAGWMRDGAPSTGTTTLTASDLTVWTNRLRFDHVTSADAGTYYLAVTNVTGVTTSEAVRLEILTPPAVGADPVSVVTCPGSTVRFSVTASGIPTPSCQWMFQGVDIPGANDTSLTLADVDASNEGDYSLRLWNSEGTATSKAANLSLRRPPVINTAPIAQTLRTGDTLLLEVHADGSGPLSYAWMRDQTPIPGANTSVLRIANASTADTGTYAVTVSNDCDEARSGPIRIDILPPPPRLQNLQMLAAFEIVGNVGTTYRIEAVDNEFSTNWSFVSRVTLTSSPQLFIDEQSGHVGARIYRAVAEP